MIADKQVYEFDLIKEASLKKRESKKMYLTNNKIILQLLSKPSTPKLICEEIGSSMHVVLLCLDRLIKKKIIRIKETIINDGKLQNIYELVSTDFSVISKYIEENSEKNSFAGEIIAKDINNITKKIINNIFDNKEKPNSIQAVFIKISSNNLVEFNKELNDLIKKYEKLEDTNEKEIYGLVNVLGLYSKVMIVKMIEKFYKYNIHINKKGGY